MPILEITQEAIGPGRTHLVTDYLASVMLWPDDAAKRARAMQTSLAQHIRGTLTAIHDVPAARLDAIAYNVLLGVMCEASPQAAIREAVGMAFRDGIVAGELLGAAVLRRDRTAPVKLDPIKHQIVERGKRADLPAALSALRVSRSTVENTILSRLKPAAHFWAAFLENYLIRREREFPCALHRVPEFLALAQLFLKAGRRTFLPRNAGRVLSGDAWELPATLTLPPVRLVPSG